MGAYALGLGVLLPYFVVSNLIDESRIATDSTVRVNGGMDLE